MENPSESTELKRVQAKQHRAVVETLSLTRKPSQCCHLPNPSDGAGAAEKAAQIAVRQLRPRSGTQHAPSPPRPATRAAPQSRSEVSIGSVRKVTLGSTVVRSDLKKTPTSSRQPCTATGAAVKAPSIDSGIKRGVLGPKRVAGTCLPKTGSQKVSPQSVDQKHTVSRITKPDRRSNVIGLQLELGSNTLSSSPNRGTVKPPNSSVIRNGQGVVNVGGQSEPCPQERLKSVLKVLRSSLSPEEKLLAIKSNHDRWNGWNHKKPQAETVGKESPHAETTGDDCLTSEKVLTASSLAANSSESVLPVKELVPIVVSINNGQKMSDCSEELSTVVVTERRRVETGNDGVDPESFSQSAGHSGPELCTAAYGAPEISEQGRHSLVDVGRPIESNVKKKDDGLSLPELDGSEGALPSAKIRETSSYYAQGAIVSGGLGVVSQTTQRLTHGHSCRSSRDVSRAKNATRRTFDRAMSCPEFGSTSTGGASGIVPLKPLLIYLGRSVAHADCDPLICDESHERSLRLSNVGSSTAAPLVVGRAGITQQYFANQASGDSAPTNIGDKEKKGDELPVLTKFKPKCQPVLKLDAYVDNTRDQSLNPNQSNYGPPKSPVTVQEWVDSINVSDRHEDGPEVSGKQPQELNLEVVDNFTLGAEEGLAPGVTSLIPKSHHIKQHHLVKRYGGSQLLGGGFKTPPTNLVSESDSHPGWTYHEREQEADHCKAQLRLSNQAVMRGPSLNKNNSFQSDTSGASTYTISSIEALLENMQHNPEEVLLGLGFGSAAPDPLSRIPERFLHPSQVKGNNLQEFLKKQQEMMEMYDMGFCGYRGLSGFSLDGRGPSGIVYKILEKIRDRNRELKRTLAAPNSSTNPPSLCFYRAAFSLMAVNAFRNSIKNSSRSSILERENREFLDSQEGSVKSGKRRPRLVLGKDSFTLDTDEELIDDDEGATGDGPTRQLATNSEGVKRPATDARRSGRTPPRRNGRKSGSVVSTSASSPGSEASRKMSDDVFAPATENNKTSFWGILRSMRMPSTPQSSPPLSSMYQEAKASPTRKERPAQTPPIAEETTVFSNSPLSLVTSDSCKRSNRLTRQASVDDDRSSEAESSLICPRRHVKLGSLKMESAANKDSFELEELPPLSDIQDGDGMEPPGRLHVNNGDTPRTSSAMSDSSGFLEGETLEVSNELLEDTLNIMLAENLDEDRTAVGPLDGSADFADVLQTSVSYVKDETAGESRSRTITGRRSPLLAMNQSESGFESFGPMEKDDVACAKIGEGAHSPLGYLSESDTIVVDAASSSSSDAFPLLKSGATDHVQNLQRSVCNLPRSVVTEQDTGVEQLESLDALLETGQEMKLLELPRYSKIDRSKSISEVDLYCAHSRRLQALGFQGSSSSLQNVCATVDIGELKTVTTDLVRSARFSGIGPLDGPCAEDSDASTTSGKISEFHKSCLLVVHRMQDVLQLYQKKLKEMERSCLDTYCHYCSGITKPERDELEKLKDLRKLLLEETNKTNILLSNRSKAIANNTARSSHPSRSSCNVRLAAVAEELGELLKEQDAFLKQLDEVHYDLLPPNPELCQHKSSGASPLGNDHRLYDFLQTMKQEIMVEIRNILKGDHEKIQSALTTTRQDIEDVKSVLTSLLSSLQSNKV